MSPDVRLTAADYRVGVRLIVVVLLAVVCLPALAAGASEGLQYSMAIYEMGVDGKQRLLSIHQSPQVFELSPDHSQFAYVLDELDGTRSSELRVAEVRGSGERSLVHAPSSIWDVAWAPNGRTIALSVVSAPSRQGVDGIWLVEADGTGLHRVADNWGAGLAWSPDSERLAMWRRIDFRPPDLISVISVDTGVTHDLTAGRDPQWSPDGGSLLYYYWLPSGLTQIRVYSGGGGPAAYGRHGMAGIVVSRRQTSRVSCAGRKGLDCSLGRFEPGRPT
jgi:Tol biopolymer transport system component